MLVPVTGAIAEKGDNVRRLQTPASTRVRSTTRIGIRGNSGTRGSTGVTGVVGVAGIAGVAAMHNCRENGVFCGNRNRRKGAVTVFSLQGTVAIRGLCVR